MTLIEQRIRQFLKLRRPPQHLKDEATQEALAAEIIKIVSKAAPQSGVDVWIGQVCEGALTRTKGMGWPALDVWAAACGAAPRSDGSQQAHEESHRERELRVFCQRINDNEPVDELSLFGQLADRALKEGLITFSTLRARQRDAFNARRKFYGGEKAFAWADEVAPALAHDMRNAEQQAEREVRSQYKDDTVERKKI